MGHNSQKIIDQVERLSEQYDLDVSRISVGESVGTVIKMRFDKACVEFNITAIRCIVIDEDGGSESFEYSLDGWEQKAFEHTEKLLKAYVARI